MAVLSLQVNEYKETMNYNGQSGCKGKIKTPKFVFPNIHVKRIQADTRAKKEYSGYGDTPKVLVQGIENRTVTLTGVFEGASAAASNITSYEDIFKNIGFTVQVIDNAAGAIFELAPNSEWNIDSFSFDRSAEKRGIFEFSMVLSYIWTDSEATQ